MSKVILITGATDGIGFLTAQMLANAGHRVLLHGRSEEKLLDAQQKIAEQAGSEPETYRADLSNFDDVDKLASEVRNNHNKLDVLINNAGVLKTNTPLTSDGLDTRIVVNCLAPYRLTKQLLPLMSTDARILNLASAAQAPVDIDALTGKRRLDDMSAYAQSKLAIILWSFDLAQQENTPVVIAVNPGSLLGTKMVKEGFGTSGNDVNIGADILCELALDEKHHNASGRYFDNDKGSFGQPAIDASTEKNLAAIMRTINELALRAG